MHDLPPMNASIAPRVVQLVIIYFLCVCALLASPFPDHYVQTLTLHRPTHRSAAEAAATRKAAKYAGLERTHIFQPVAVENLGTMNAPAYGFLAGLGHLATTVKTAICSSEFPLLIQRFNATLLHESFADENRSVD